MRIRNITLVISAVAMAGLGLEAWAQQRPAAGASAASSVVVYKSPT